jgi:hypothetical protein
VECEIGDGFEILEHKRSSGISSFEEYFILKFSKLDFSAILECVEKQNLKEHPDGYSFHLKIDNDESVWIFFNIHNNTIEYHFDET